MASAAPSTRPSPRGLRRAEVPRGGGGRRRVPRQARLRHTGGPHGLHALAGDGRYRRGRTQRLGRRHAAPGRRRHLFEKALTESEKVFWHLSYDGSRWRFNIEPNVNAIIETEKRNVANTAVAAMVDTLIRNAFSNDGGAKAIHFPTGPVDIPDEAGLRVVVLDYNVVTVTQKGADQPPAMVVEMLDKVGSVGTPRKFRNSVVFAVPDEEQVEVLKDRARALIASNNLAN